MECDENTNSVVKLLDGGFASQLITAGLNYIDRDPLWSARLLYSDQPSVVEGHKMFLQSGADIIETNSYQASIAGFQEFLGLDKERSIELIQRSVHLAKEAIERVQCKGVTIAGSVGPYGACQHDGSEYSGTYVDGMDIDELAEWHLPRVKALVDAGVNVLAFETIPSQKEAECLVKLLHKFPGMKAWLAFSCKDGLHVNHGERLSDAVNLAVHDPQITHVGVNCTSPSHMASLLESIQWARSLKPFIVYPNSGESWTSGVGWDGQSKLDDISSFVNMCIDKGATIIGGCCRMTADKIAVMRQIIDSHNSNLQNNVVNTAVHRGAVHHH